MVNLLHPAIKVMDRLNYSKKIMLLGFIIILSMSFLSAGLYRSLNNTIEIAKLEMEGLEQVESVLNLIQLTQKNRGLSAAVRGETALLSVYNANTKKLDAVLHAVLEQLNPMMSLKTRDDSSFSNLSDSWANINKHRGYDSIEEDFIEHTHFIQQLQLLLRMIGDHYHLITETELDTYYLMDSILVLIPGIAEDIGKIRAQVTGVLVNKQLSSTQHDILVSQLSRINKRMHDLRFNLTKVKQYAPHIGGGLEQLYLQLNNKLLIVLSLIRSDILTYKFQTDSDQFYLDLTKDIDSLYSYVYLHIIPAIKDSLENRLKIAEKELWLELSLAIFFILLIIYLLLALASALVRNINHVNEVLASYVQGNLTNRVSLTTQDEMLSVGESINTVARRISQLMADNQQEKERFETLFEKSGNGLVLIATGMIIVDCNEAAVKMLGYASKDKLIENAQHLFPEYQPDGQSSIEKSIEIYQQCLRDGQVQFEWVYKKKDGSEFWVDVLLTLLNYDGEDLVHASWRDVSVNKALELERDYQKKRLSNIIEMAMDAAILMSDKGIIIGWNSQAETIFGWSKEQALGQVLHKLIIPANVKVQHIVGYRHALVEGVLEKNVPIKRVALNSRGIEFPVEIMVSMIKQGNKIEFSAFVRDLTAQVNYEKSIIKAKEEADIANQSKSEFLANMSHELRTPMHGILSFSGFGMKKTESASREKLQQYFENINVSGNRLLVLLNDLLDLSKLDAGKMELHKKKANLQDVFQDCCLEQEQRMNDLNLTIVVNNEGKMEAEFDRIRIIQVITNLLSNAIKFSSRSSVISVAIQSDEQWLTFTMQDQGVGIPSDELLSIFDAFIQSSKTDLGAGGTGLGLAISKKIIEAHGGKIWAGNTTEGGAIFSFILPNTISLHTY